LLFVKLLLLLGSEMLLLLLLLLLLLKSIVDLVDGRERHRDGRRIRVSRVGADERVFVCVLVVFIVVKLSLWHIKRAAASSSVYHGEFHLCEFFLDLDIDEADKLGRADGLFDTRERVALAPFVEFLAEGIVLSVEETDFACGKDTRATRIGDESDRRVDDCALGGTADGCEIGKNRCEVEEPAV
jgi:hypothetical protein